MHGYVHANIHTYIHIGTCDAFPRATRQPGECKITLHMYQGAFTLYVYNCGGIPSQTSSHSGGGLVTRGPQFVGSVFSEFSNVLERRYGFLDFAYSWGGPAVNPDAKDQTDRTARATYFYSTGMQTIEINLLPPGWTAPLTSFGYPDHYTGSDLLFPFACQILTLNKVSRLPQLPQALPRADVRLFINVWEHAAKLKRCNNTMHAKLFQGSSSCADTYRTVMEFRGSRFEERAKRDAFAQVCRSTCFEEVNATLHQVAGVCLPLWTDVLRRPVQHSAYTGVVSLFAAMMVDLADARAWMSMACTTNYYQSSCMVSALRQNDVITAGKCPQFDATVGNTVNVSSAGYLGKTGVKTPGAWAGAGFNLGADGDSALVCTSRQCQEAMLDLVASDQCCPATTEQAKALWWDLVLPAAANVQSLAVDVSVYKCRVLGTCSTTAGQANNKGEADDESAREMILLEAPNRGECPQTGPARTTVSCVLSLCNMRLWPEPCCTGLVCKNGGKKAYDGACFCDCPASYVSADCSARAAEHMIAYAALVNVRVSLFNARIFLGNVAAELKVSESALEIHHVSQKYAGDASVGGRRHGRNDKPSEITESEVKQTAGESHGDTDGGLDSSSPQGLALRNPKVESRAAPVPTYLIVALRIFNNDPKVPLPLAAEKIAALMGKGKLGGYTATWTASIEGVNLGVQLLSAEGKVVCEDALVKCYQGAVQNVKVTDQAQGVCVGTMSCVGCWRVDNTDV